MHPPQTQTYISSKNNPLQCNSPPSPIKLTPSKKKVKKNPLNAPLPLPNKIETPPPPKIKANLILKVIHPPYIKTVLMEVSPLSGPTIPLHCSGSVVCVTPKLKDAHYLSLERND